MPLSPPLVDTAVTVMVCPVPPEAEAMLAAPPAPCPDPPACPDMVGGIYVSVFGPEVVTITGALGATGGTTGSVDATGAMSIGIAICRHLQ